jgi:hypothetical protein
MPTLEDESPRASARVTCLLRRGIPACVQDDAPVTHRAASGQLAAQALLGVGASKVEKAEQAFKFGRV